MGKYDRQIAQAQRKIKAKGAIVTWRKIHRAADTTQPWKTDVNVPANQDFQVSMVFLRQGNLASSIIHLMRNTDVTEGAPDALLAGGLPFTPELTDAVIQNGQTFVISNIDMIAPDGTPILYLLRFE